MSLTYNPDVFEVRDIAEAKRIISENPHIIEALRDALIARDELVGREIIEVIERAAHPAPVAQH